MTFAGGTLRSGGRSGSGLPSCRATTQRSGRDAEALCPLRNVQRLASDRETSVAARVEELLFIGRPSAVRWLVVAVVLAAIKGVRRARPRTHVREERFEGLQPPRAHGNAPRPIARPRRMIGVRAALNHVAPGEVLRRALDRVPMRFGSRSALGRLAAAATGGSTTPQRRGVDHALRAACAAAPPERLSPLAPSGERLHPQLSEVLTNQRESSLGVRHAA